MKTQLNGQCKILISTLTIFYFVIGSCFLLSATAYAAFGDGLGQQRVDDSIQMGGEGPTTTFGDKTGDLADAADGTNGFTLQDSTMPGSTLQEVSSPGSAFSASGAPDVAATTGLASGDGNAPVFGEARGTNDLGIEAADVPETNVLFETFFGAVDMRLIDTKLVIEKEPLNGDVINVAKLQVKSVNLDGSADYVTIDSLAGIQDWNFGNEGTKNQYVHINGSEGSMYVYSHYAYYSKVTDNAETGLKHIETFEFDYDSVTVDAEDLENTLENIQDPVWKVEEWRGRMDIGTLAPKKVHDVDVREVDGFMIGTAEEEFYSAEDEVVSENQIGELKTSKELVFENGMYQYAVERSDMGYDSEGVLSSYSEQFKEFRGSQARVNASFDADREGSKYTIGDNIPLDIQSSDQRVLIDVGALGQEWSDSGDVLKVGTYHKIRDEGRFEIATSLNSSGTYVFKDGQHQYWVNDTSGGTEFRGDSFSGFNGRIIFSISDIYRDGDQWIQFNRLGSHVHSDEYLDELQAGNFWTVNRKLGENWIDTFVNVEDIGFIPGEHHLQYDYDEEVFVVIDQEGNEVFEFDRRGVKLEDNPSPGIIFERRYPGGRFIIEREWSPRFGGFIEVGKVQTDKAGTWDYQTDKTFVVNDWDEAYNRHGKQLSSYELYWESKTYVDTPEGRVDVRVGWDDISAFQQIDVFDFGNGTEDSPDGDKVKQRILIEKNLLAETGEDEYFVRMEMEYVGHDYDFEPLPILGGKDYELKISDWERTETDGSFSELIVTVDDPEVIVPNGKTQLVFRVDFADSVSPQSSYYWI